MLIIDREFIERCCSEYDRRNQGKYDQIEETAILNWVSKQSGPKFLNREYFIRVGRWKTPRYAATRETNDEHNIIETTRSAYLAKGDLLKLNILKRLKGVGNAVASTILYYLQPDKFAVFDYHVRNTLKQAGKLTKGEEDNSAKVWLKCTQEIRELLSLHNKTLREVEKALFAYDKWGCGGSEVESKSEGEEMDKNNKDSILEVHLPPRKMEQLEGIAREFNEDKATLAKIWIIERLLQLCKYEHLPSAKPQITPEQRPAQVAEEVKRALAERYLSDDSNRDEKCLFLQAPDFHEWAPYIAGFVLTNENGRAEFRPKDIKNILKDEIIPEHYNKPGFPGSRVLPADVHVDALRDYPHGFPSLELVDKEEHLYRFVGLREGIRRRYGGEALEERLRNCS